MDCLWGPWSEWGSCSKCGDQRYRNREVIQLANLCGRRCDAKDGKETANCTSPCEKEVWCAWSDWSGYSKCSSDCGPATRLRQRSLELRREEPVSSEDYLFSATDELATCNSMQLQADGCPYRSCDSDEVPVDCMFGHWGPWSSPACTQLCTRQRVIKTMNKFGGKVCSGRLAETKHCPHNCSEPDDCILTVWSDWDECKGPESQKFRRRHIDQLGSHGGKLCDGILEETRDCVGPKQPAQACSFSAWSSWDKCSRTCGGGLRRRGRKIEEPSLRGGDLCKGKLVEIDMCNTDSCLGPPEECKVGDWSEWGECTKSFQQYRERKVVDEGRGQGKACNMALKEIRPCRKQVDCVVSEWTPWDTCDKTCGGGQQQKHRQVVTNPRNGGASCPGELILTQGCNSDPCDRSDCVVSSWNEWSLCEVTCGSGQQSRNREVVQLAKAGGHPCADALMETRPCADKAGKSMPRCEMKDCLWSEWSEWSSCSCDCDGGQKTRDRTIQQSPDKGGKPCKPEHKEEVIPCNTHKCSKAKCIDGAWGDWEAWEPCSKSCEGGLTWRSRKISQEANACGTPVQGDAREFASCNSDTPCRKDLDCSFSTWGTWSDCTKSCGGVKRRSRVVENPGAGKGKFCIGDLKQTSPCNPGIGEEIPAECKGPPPVDCLLGDWNSWSACSATCGSGSHSRYREIVHERFAGGKACEGPLAVQQTCNNLECEAQCQPVDCLWADWTSWSACDKCGGQRKRFRHVSALPVCGGKLCDPTLAEETTNCTRMCHEPIYCGFGEWESWSVCDATCGEGVRMRSRQLELHVKDNTQSDVFRTLSDNAEEADDVEALQARIERLASETQALERRRAQEMMVAFGCGFGAIIIGMTLFRAARRLDLTSSRASSSAVE